MKSPEKLKHPDKFVTKLSDLQVTKPKAKAQRKPRA